MIAAFSDRAGAPLTVRAYKDLVESGRWSYARFIAEFDRKLDRSGVTQAFSSRKGCGCAQAGKNNLLRRVRGRVAAAKHVRFPGRAQAASALRRLPQPLTSKSVTSGTASTSHRDDIDGLRALAVLMVVAYHVAPNVVPGGFVGVDIFFVICGYLISGNILKDPQPRQVLLPRILVASLPAHHSRPVDCALWCLAARLVHAASGGIPRARKTHRRRSHVHVECSVVARVRIFRRGRRLEAAAASLVIGDRGTVLYRLAGDSCGRLEAGTPRSLVATLALLLGSFALNIGNTQTPPATFYLLPTRFWELLLGAALVQAESRSRIHTFFPRPDLAAWCAAGLIVGAAHFSTAIGYIRDGRDWCRRSVPCF